MHDVQHEGAVVMISRGRIRPFADQPRDFFDPDELQLLAKSIKTVGQLVPIIVMPLKDSKEHDYELIDGQRRWFACEIASVEKMKAWVVEVANKEQQFLFSAIS